MSVKANKQVLWIVSSGSGRSTTEERYIAKLTAIQKAQSLIGFSSNIRVTKETLEEVFYHV